MKMHHKAADKLFVHYSSDSLSFIDRATGEQIKTALFVCSVEVSSYSYAEGYLSQNQKDFGGLPQAVVPDTLKSANTKANRDHYSDHPHHGPSAFPERIHITILLWKIRKPGSRYLKTKRGSAEQMMKPEKTRSIE
ncbi:MAG: hypothetical protein ACQEQ4_11240 [Fibrobacterota bacterium]